MNDHGSAQTEDARYRHLVESVTDYAIFMLDASGRIATWNIGAQRVKGYGTEEILGEHFSRLYTEEDRAQGLPERALAIAAEKGSFTGEGWRVRKDGTRFWASVTIHPIRGDDGGLEGYAKITRDLSAHLDAQEALAISQEQFKLLVQSVTDYAIFMLDPEGRVVSWNQGAQRIKGYLPDEIIGHHFSRFYTEADREAGVPAEALRTATTEGRFEKEGTRVRKDGTTFRAHVVIDPVRNKHGELIGFAKITRDITERYEAQLALEKAKEALFQSQKMESIGQLTGGVAHDFNNLLMAILGSLELLTKRLPEDKQMKRLAENATQAARRGATLTQRMLAFARRHPLDSKPVNVAELVRGMSDLLDRSIGPTIRLETKFVLRLPPVLADENQLELALLNLVTNARDAMPDGGTIEIAGHDRTVEPGDPSGLNPGRYVCLSVSDEGAGMDPDTLAHAVEPFFTTKGVGKGTGLGLPMVHGMAEQSGGKLILKSEKGVGTRVEICLPVVAPAAASPEVTIPPVIELPSIKILAVDDDPLVLFNTVAMLEDMGHTVIQASSAQAALELLEETDVDLVITDQAMPKMTGVQLAKALSDQGKHMPVVIATGYGELPTGIASKLTLLPKPFDESALRTALIRVTKG